VSSLALTSVAGNIFSFAIYITQSLLTLFLSLTALYCRDTILRHVDNLSCLVVMDEYEGIFAVKNWRYLSSFFYASNNITGNFNEKKNFEN